MMYSEAINVRMMPNANLFQVNVLENRAIITVINPIHVDFLSLVSFVLGTIWDSETSTSSCMQTEIGRLVWDEKTLPNYRKHTLWWTRIGTIKGSTESHRPGWLHFITYSIIVRVTIHSCAFLKLDILSCLEYRDRGTVYLLRTGEICQGPYSSIFDIPYFSRCVQWSVPYMWVRTYFWNTETTWLWTLYGSDGYSMSVVCLYWASSALDNYQ